MGCLGNLVPTSSVGYAFFHSGGAGLQIKEPGRKHAIPVWFSNTKVVEELAQKHLCGRTEAEKQRESDIRRCVLDRYFGDGQDAASIAKELEDVFGHGVTSDAVEKLIQRLKARGDRIASRLGIEDTRRPARIGTKFITIEGHEICPLPGCSASFREVAVYAPHAAAFCFTCDTFQFDPFFQKQNHKDKTAPRLKKSRGWTPEAALEPRGNPWRPAHCIGLGDLDALLGRRRPCNKVLRHHAEARESVRRDAQVRDFIAEYNKVSDGRTTKPVRLGRDKRESTNRASACVVLPHRFADSAPVAQPGPFFLATNADASVGGVDMTNISCGNQFRGECERRRISFGSFGVAVDIPKHRLSAFACEYIRLTPPEISRIERTLDAIEAIQRIISPARLDGSDGISLKAAVDAYLDGCWFKELQRFAVERVQTDPSVITF
jgi:hypothetical protein